MKSGSRSQMEEPRTNMLEIGDVVDVEVESVEVFGIFCRHESQEMLVMIPETSWIASFCSCKQFTQPGDYLKVKIKRVDRESGKIAASMKDLHPNPWETDQLQTGNEHTARIVRHVPEADRCNNGPGHLIELLPGAYAMLCANGLSFQTGQRCTVTIVKSDPIRHAVQVTIVGR